MDIKIPEQTIQIPDAPEPTPPYDDTAIKVLIEGLDKRLKVLEADLPVPAPEPIPTPPPSTGFSLYASDSFWNKKLSSPVIHSNSRNLVTELRANVDIAGGWVSGLKEPAFGTSIYYVDATTPKVRVHIKNDWTDRYIDNVPMPSNPIIAAGTDGHLCIISKAENREWDFFQLRKTTTEWMAHDCGVLSNVSTSDGRLPRLAHWNSATATHLPLAGGKVTLKESLLGVINQCLFISINRPKKGTVVWPAQTSDGWYEGANAIPEGTRFFFPQTVSIDPAWTPMTKMFVRAIKDRGMVVGDKTGAGVSFYHEDTTQYGKVTATHLRTLMGGKEIWNILGSKSNVGEFPWLKLEAIA